MTETPHDLVLNIRPASASMIRAMDRHERERKPDGVSAIDPMRSHLNEVLQGPKKGPSAAVEQLYESGVQRPARQSESPYIQIVVSASASYFRPDDPDARGTWDPDRLEEWRARTEAWLREEFGDDLVHAAIHLDEDTPHVHALVAPTYEKKPRIPGRRKKSETEEDFQARRQAAIDAPSVRTVGRASHADLSKKGSFQRLRERAAIAVHDLGIGYGEDRSPDAPPGISTREWVARETVRLRNDQAALDAERAELRAWSDDLAAERDEIAADREKVDEDRAEINDLREEDQRVLNEARAEIADDRAEIAADRVEIKAERTRLNEKLRDVKAAYDAAKGLLRDLRQMTHLSRDFRDGLRDGLRELRDALQPPKKKTEREKIVDQIAQASAPKQSPDDPDDGPSL